MNTLISNKSYLKKFILVVLASLLIFSLFSTNVVGATKIKSGQICVKKNQKIVQGSKTFICSPKGSKLVWKLKLNNKPVTSTPNVSEPAVTPKPTRTTQDRPDELIGFQIKFIYVVPSDGADRQLDVNGDLSRVIDQGNDFLFKEIGKKFQIDSYQNFYDIEYFKSKYSSQEMRDATDLHKDLYSELKIADRLIQNRKLYSFLVDVGVLAKGTACGYTNISDFRNVVAVGPQCSGRSGQFEDNRVTAWVHEALHNIGVTDTDGDGCEFISHDSCNKQIWQIDPERKYYVGAATKSGGDIMNLRVWQDNATNKEIELFCQVDSPTLSANCTTGATFIGPPRYQWNNFGSAELFELVNGVGQKIGTGSKSNKPWGNSATYTCSSGYTCPSLKISQKDTGIKEYYWVIDGNTGDRFKINWTN